MQYYDIPKEDYLKCASLRGKEWNGFVDQNHRSTCTNCGKDYLYCGGCMSSEFDYLMDVDTIEMDKE